MKLLLIVLLFFLSSTHLTPAADDKIRKAVENGVVWSYWKLHRNGEAKFDRFRDAVFSFEADVFEIRFNGTPMSVATRDAEWKDAQIFPAKPQPTSGYKPRPIDPRQRLLRLDCAGPGEAWKLGVNKVEIRISSRAPSVKSAVQIEKVEAHVKYDPA